MLQGPSLGASDEVNFPCANMGRPRAALVLLSVFLSIGVVNATDKLKLRGVPHSLKPAYAPLAPSPELLGLLPGYISTSTALTKDEELWKCLNGQVIPWAFVNDDYCDCADGSDEPGTSACGHIEKARWVFFTMEIGIRGWILGGWDGIWRLKGPRDAGQSCSDC